MNDFYVSSVLDELVPRFEDEQGDWPRVLVDAGVAPGHTRPVGNSTSVAGRVPDRRWPVARLTRRRLVVVAVAALAIAIPLVAAASQDWWFFKVAGSAPDPTTDVAVLKSGVWDRKPWQLAAYLSATDGICFSLAPTATTGQAGDGAALNCDAIEGVPRTDESKPYVPHAITFLTGSSVGFPAYIVGPVIDKADEVAIHLDDGSTIATPTFDVPKELGSIRFYATQLPELERSPGEPRRTGIQRLVGLTSEGEVVACLVPSMTDTVVPISACR